MLTKSLTIVAVLVSAACALTPVTHVTQNFHGLAIPMDFTPEPEFEGDFKFKNAKGEIIMIRERESQSQEQALKEARRKWEILGEILLTKVDPYFGKRDSGPTCDAKAIPPSTEALDAHAFVKVGYLYATAEQSYGSCSEAADKLKSQLLWIYCKNSTKLYEVRYFFAKAMPWPRLAVTSCQ